MELVRRRTHTGVPVLCQGPIPGGGTCAGGAHESDRRRSFWFGFFMFLLALIACTAGFVGWWTYLATETQRDAVRDVAAGTAAAGRSAIEWAKEKIR